MVRITTQGGQFLVEYKDEIMEKLFSKKDLCIIANSAHTLAAEHFHLKEIEGMEAIGEFFLAKFPFTEQSQTCGCPLPVRLVKSLGLLSLIDMRGKIHDQFVIWGVINQKSLLYRRYKIILPEPEQG